VAKWQELLKDFARLPVVTQKAILNWLQETDPATLPEDVRAKIWDGLRHLVREHRFFHDAFWALPPDRVDELDVIEQKIAPADPIIRSKWLFGHGGDRAFGDTETPYEERNQMQEKAQCEALREVFRAKGLPGILELASTVSSSYVIGALVAKLGLVPEWRELLPVKLLPTQGNAYDLARGYTRARIVAEGDSFIAAIPLEEWPQEAVAEFTLMLDFNKKAWEILRQRKPQAEETFWKRVSGYAGPVSDDDLEESVKCLLKAGRPFVAVDALSCAIHGKKKPAWNLAADVLDSASITSKDDSPDRPINQHSIWELCELMKYLQSDPNADQERLSILEWRFLPLARHHDFAPKTLHVELSRNPKFFAEVIEAQFRARNEPRDKSQPPDPNRQKLAEIAFNLLESWAGIPGTRPDGSIDLSVLKVWVEDVRKLCTASDRLEVCDLKIGEQLAFAPADKDGTWPCEAVREILEFVPTDQILRGFDCAVSNKRGSYTKSMNEGGEQERALAKKYSDYANKCKVSWPRTALALRRLAESYEAQAKQEDESVEGRD